MTNNKSLQFKVLESNFGNIMLFDKFETARNYAEIHLLDLSAKIETQQFVDIANYVIRSSEIVCLSTEVRTCFHDVSKFCISCELLLKGN